MQNRWGVYMIQSVLFPDRVYIGSSTTVKNRIRDHKIMLKNNHHHSAKLQNHYNKYGLDDLIFEEVEYDDYIDVTHLLAREQVWCGKYSFNGADIPYFNILPTTGTSKGYEHTPEHREKNSQAHKGKKHTEEHNEKIAQAQMGENNSMYGVEPWNKGKKGLQKNPNKGKKGVYSEETLAKMRISNKRAWEIRKQKQKENAGEN